jgi:hypothetical protein
MEPFVDFGLFEVLAVVAGVRVLRRGRRVVSRWWAARGLRRTRPAPVAIGEPVGRGDDGQVKGDVDGHSTA